MLDDELVEVSNIPITPEYDLSKKVSPNDEEGDDQESISKHKDMPEQDLDNITEQVDTE